MTPRPRSPHPRFVRSTRSVAAALAVLAILAIQAGTLCQGWQSTAEARMSCCVAGGGCTMHESEPSDGAGDVVLQADADRCCAASESDDSSAPSAAFAQSISSAVLGTVAPLLDMPPSATLEMRWRLVAPSPPARVSKHVLFSVFLV